MFEVKYLMAICVFKYAYFGDISLAPGRIRVHVRYMSSEVKPCVVWALRVLLPFLAKLIEDSTNNDRVGPTRLEKAVW
jgi:hypothetical protein